MARLSGRYAEVTMTIAAGTAIVVPMASYTVNMETEFIDATNFGDTNKVEVRGLPSLGGDFSGFYDTTTSYQLFAAAQATGIVTLSIAFDTENYPTWTIDGPANVSASMTQNVSGAIEYSGSWSAAGAWDLSALIAAPTPGVLLREGDAKRTEVADEGRRR
jgi:hypothetical protein